MNQVLLVSDQPMPNFLPVLNSAMKPDSVTLVVSSKMRKRAEWLKAEIAKHQVKILPDIDVGDDVADINAIQSTLMNWVDANEKVFGQSILNVTGGTKTMAIAAQEVFRHIGDSPRPVFYVDIATDKVTWLNGEHEGMSLLSTPTLGQFFRLNGIEIVSGDFSPVVENEKWRHFYGEIAADPRKWALPIRALNGIAFQAEDNRTRDFEVNDETLALPNWIEMSQMLHADELVTYKQGGKEEFCSSEARRFCNGIWLEHYVFEVLKSFGFDKKRALMNVKIVDDRGNQNELDSVVLRGNTCYVIEDKTKNMRGAGVVDSAVYKLAQLSSKMGLKTRGILVSALGVRPVDKDRARAYNVEIFDWLPDLEGNLRRLFGK